MRWRRRILDLLLIAALAGAPPLAAQEADEAAAYRRAYELWQEGYLNHMVGDYAAAIDRFRASIVAHPTAEGHTYLGWSLSSLGRLDEAIGECQNAIALDPDYGNPYNDIGVYLIELGRPDDAVPWLEKAIGAARYCCYEFAHFNLGRVRLMQGRDDAARQSFERALDHAPDYMPARDALRWLRQRSRTL